LEAPASAFDSKWCSSSDMLAGSVLSRAEKEKIMEEDDDFSRQKRTGHRHFYFMPSFDIDRQIKRLREFELGDNTFSTLVNVFVQS
jgi:hypothetical protein